MTYRFQHSFRALLIALAGLLLIAARPANASTPPLDVGCNWFSTPISVSTGNTGYIDSHASYFVAALPNQQYVNAQIIVEGRYPHVRYFSLQLDGAYGASNILGQLADYELIPEDGGPANTNPAALPYSNDYQAHYRIIIKFEDAPETPEPNTLYVGAQLDPGSLPQIVFRRYLANPGYDVLDPSELPTLTYVGPQGTIPLAQTPNTAACALLDAELELGANTTLWLNPVLAPPSSAFSPIWFIDAIPYPNDDSAYLEALTSTHYASMFVVRVKVPLTPGTAGTAEPQARYWSICQDELHTTATVACLADTELVAQSDGYTTIIITPKDQRPELANTSHGYNWLPWGDIQAGYVPLRETLAAPGFSGSYQKAVDKFWLPMDRTLGAYAPQSTYCDTATFNAYAAQGGGVLIQACQAAQAPGHGTAGTTSRR